MAINQRGITIGPNEFHFIEYTTDDDGVITGQTIVEFGKKQYKSNIQTTDATLTIVASLKMPDDIVYGIDAKIVARRTGGISGENGDGLYYYMSAAFKNIGGVASQIGSTVVIADIKDQLAWDVSFNTNAPTSVDTVIVQVLGAVDNDIDWICFLNYSTNVIEY